jgi:hypothetical protein
MWLTREAEAEAWVRKPKRIIHNQSLIQILIMLAMIIPLPLVGVVFWLLFAFASPIVIQTVVLVWTASTVIYGTTATYVRVKERNTVEQG